jgi:nitrous oxidase accessory protein NosD
LEAKPLIVGNHCRSNQAAGIGLRPGCHGILWRNRCEDNKLVAIGLPQGAQALIAENVLSRKGGMPPLVAIRGGSRAIFSNNKLDGGGVAGILIEGSAILTGNTIVGHNEKFGQGIWLWKGSRALGEENKIEGFKNTVSVSEGASWTGARP